MNTGKKGPSTFVDGPYIWSEWRDCAASPLVVPRLKARAFLLKTCHRRIFFTQKDLRFKSRINKKTRTGKSLFLLFGLSGGTARLRRLWSLA
jgi:hypothetical protein